MNGDGPTVGGAIIQNADYICFTGSTKTGRLVAKQAGERLIGCSLELGGKNPMLVLRDADVNRAAEGAVRACFANAGQLCVSMERLYVADQVYDAFVTAFLDRVKKLKSEAGTGWDVDMGSLISKAQLETVTRHVEDAREQGAVRYWPAAGPGRTSARCSTSRPCCPGSPRRWSASTTRPSGRSCRSTGSPTRPRRSSARTRASTA